MDFAPGLTVAGRYRLTKIVGAGGMGEVWAGEEAETGKKVAIKRLLPSAAKHHEVVARFRREALILGRLKSGYVARVIDFIDEPTFGLVLVMEFIEGPSLAHILEDRTLSVEEAIDLAIDLVQALCDLHDAKIIHRDLKPGNIIMRPSAGDRPRAVVVDFGISRVVSSETENEVTGITRANIALGTVEYMAPEQILNSRDVTPVTDLYAVGIILFRAVKGHHAFGDRRGEDLARAKLIEEAPPLELARNDDLTKGLAAVVARALKKKPSLRYKSASDMLGEVRALEETARQAVDLDDTTADGSTTAVKPSPLARADTRPEAARRASMPSNPGEAQGRPEAPTRATAESNPSAPQPARGISPPAPMFAVESSQNRAARQGSIPEGVLSAGVGRGSLPSISEGVVNRAPLPSISEVGPSRGSMPSISEAGASRASRPSIPESVSSRGSMPSISDAVPPTPRSAGSNDGAYEARASLPDFGHPPSMPGSRPMSGVARGTVALAVLTAFAVGAAVGLVVAPAPATSASSAPSANASACAPCEEKLAASERAASSAAAALAVPPPIDLDEEEASSQPIASAKPAKPPKPVLTGKMPAGAWVPPTSAPSVVTPAGSGGLPLGGSGPPKPGEPGSSSSTGSSTSLEYGGTD